MDTKARQVLEDEAKAMKDDAKMAQCSARNVCRGVTSKSNQSEPTLSHIWHGLFFSFPVNLLGYREW